MSAQATIGSICKHLRDASPPAPRHLQDPDPALAMWQERRCPHSRPLRRPPVLSPRAE